MEYEGVVLRRWREGDAEALVAAVSESLEHLRPWMPWAQEVPGLQAQREWLAGQVAAFDAGDEFTYAITAPGSRDEILGSCGLHRRKGPDAMEIGYWVHAAHARKGLATRAVHAVTQVAWKIGLTRVEIHCDEANVASAAVARRAGFEFTALLERTPKAPSETGREMVWTKARSR